MVASEVNANFAHAVSQINANAVAVNTPIVGALPFPSLIQDQIADANKVMANFEFLRSQVNGNASALTSPAVGAYPYTLKNGTTRDADEVNANFDHLLTEVNANVATGIIDEVFFYENGSDRIGSYKWFGTFWAINGNTIITPDDAGDPAITNLSNTRLATVGNFGGGTPRILSTYDFNGSTYTLQGSGLQFGGSSADNDCAALNSTDIAFCQGGTVAGNNIKLATYRFNGSTWSLVGNALDTGDTAVGTGVTRLSSNTVAYYHGTSQDIRVYSFDGTDWSQVGGTQSFTVSFEVEIVTIDANKIAIFGINERVLTVYSWNGSTFSQVGGTFLLGGGSGSWSMASFQTDTIAAFNDTANLLFTYTFNGTTWSQVGSSLSVSLVGDVAWSSSFKP